MPDPPTAVATATPPPAEAPPGPTPTPSPDSSAQGGWGGGSSSGYGCPGGTTSLSGSASCGGPAITATYTWVHDGSGQTDQNDPPPQAEIVEEGCDTQWSSNQTSAVPGYTVSGTLGGNPFWSGPDPSGPYGGDEKGVKYSAQGGGTISTSQTPTCSAKGSGGSPGTTSYSASVSVNYGLGLVSAVTVNLGGTLTDGNGKPILDSSGNQQILVGQQCTATIIGVSVPGATITYAWTVAGNKVANYVVSADQTTGTPTPFTSPNTNSACWYWSDKAGTEAISCTATVTPATGQGAQFSVTATKTVQLQTPPVIVNILSGAVQLNGTNSGTFQTPYALYLGSPDTNKGQGIAWTGQVNQPSVFNSQGAGSWQFTQLITPTRSRTISKGTPQHSSNDGRSGLDSYDPYGNATYTADNSKNTNGDSPGFGIQDTYSNYTVAETFQTYVMYKPPAASGGNSILVPLYEIDWKWGANVNIVNGSWASFGNNSVGGTLTITSKQAQTQHPSWKMLISKPPVW